MPTQAHSKAIWRESSASGLVPVIIGLRLIIDGPDRVYSATGPEAAAFVNDGTGTYVLTDLPLAPGADRLDAVLSAGTAIVY